MPVTELLLFEHLFPLKLMLTFAVVELRNGHFDRSLGSAVMNGWTLSLWGWVAHWRKRFSCKDEVEADPLSFFLYHSAFFPFSAMERWNKKTFSRYFHLTSSFTVFRIMCQYILVHDKLLSVRCFVTTAQNSLTGLMLHIIMPFKISECSFSWPGLGLWR